MASELKNQASSTADLNRPKKTPIVLPVDRRGKQGGWLFLGSLLIFFLSSLFLYGLYAYSRKDDPLSDIPLPKSFLISTVCLLAISVLVHAATRQVRRDQFRSTAWLLGISTASAIVFTVVQCIAMNDLLLETISGPGRGVIGMVIVLAVLHALHVLGGIVALGIVAVRSSLGRYDHERHWPVDFAAQYWHFLDLVWVCMIGTFWLTTGGFGFL